MRESGVLGERAIAEQIGCEFGLAYDPFRSSGVCG